MKNNPIALSVIIPAFNEASRIKETIHNCNKYLNESGVLFEIIVVDDGSTDSTSDIVTSLKKKQANIQLIKLEKNQGKGRAVQVGMMKADGVNRLFMDADGSTSISEIEKLLPYLKHFEVIIGSRALVESRIKNNQVWYRRFFGKIGNKLIRLLFGLNISDTQCGFKLFTNNAADFIFPSLTLNRFGFDIEVLAIAKYHGLKIKEVPVVWSHSDGSKVKAMDYLDVLLSVFKVKVKMIFGLYK